MPIVPDDRSSDVPVVGCCYNKTCKPSSNADRYEFILPSSQTKVACPKCGADQGPTVFQLVLTHLLVLDPNGKIKGEGGLNYRVACNEDRVVLATETNLEAATGDLRFANCPACLKAAQNMPKVSQGGYQLKVE